MQKIFRILVLMLTTALVACGGGGGDPGTSSGSQPPAPAVLRTSAPDGLTMMAGTSQEFVIEGGKSPYRVVSSNVAIATALIENNKLTVNALIAGDTDLSVSDANGAVVKIAVAVKTLGLRTSAPNVLTMMAGTTQDFVIEGGKSPYRVVSSNVAVARALIENTKLTVNALIDGKADISVSDAAGSVITVAVTVETLDTTRPLFTTAPATVNIAQGEDTTYTITGGRAPYTATSSDLSVVRSTVSGSTLAMTGVNGGSASVIVSDMNNSTKTIQVIVGSSTAFFTNAPSSITFYKGDSQNYLLSGGAKPYQVVSSNAAVAQGRISGSVLTVNASKIGSATLQLTDSKGTTLTLKVDVVTDSPTTPTPVDPNPVLKSAGLKDSAGMATNSISASGYTTLNVTLTSPNGAPLANQLIVVSGDAQQVKFPEGPSGLTDAAGMASIKVARATLEAKGAGALTVTFSYKVGSIRTYPDGSPPPTADTVISTYVGYQLATANVQLVNLDVGASTLAAYGTRQVSVQANLNGSPSNTPVLVNFTATCGQISPASGSTNSAGLVTTSYSAVDAPGATQSTQGCSGKTVEITASTIGAAVVTKTLNIAGAPATNLGFVSAKPERIYLANSGGITQSTVIFKLENARGEALLGQDVILTLKTLGGGVPKASFGTVGNMAAITLPTDSEGKVSVPVFSGTVPTNVLVNAALKSDPKVQTDSAVLAIASGRPAQARMSLSIEKLAIEGFNVDGIESKVTMSLADRQGNPVPDGTVVNFVTSGGVMIPPTCTTGVVPGDSRCSVVIRSQNPRIAAHNGRVQILGYSAGEEDFVDTNKDNIYNCGESWTDLGIAFRDDNLNGIFDTGEFSVPRAASPSACGATGAAGYPDGDRVWGAADVRMQSTIIFATGGAVITGDATPARLFVTIADGNGNSMPTSSAVLVRSSIGGCGASILGGFQSKIANMLAPSLFSIPLTGCKAGDSIEIEVTSPLGLTTTRSFDVQ